MASTAEETAFAPAGFAPPLRGDMPKRSAAAFWDEDDFFDQYVCLEGSTAAGSASSSTANNDDDALFFSGFVGAVSPPEDEGRHVPWYGTEASSGACEAHPPDIPLYRTGASGGVCKAHPPEDSSILPCRTASADANYGPAHTQQGCGETTRQKKQPPVSLSRTMPSMRGGGSISDSELLRLEGLSMHSPRTAVAPPQAATSSLPPSPQAPAHHHGGSARRPGRLESIYATIRGKAAATMRRTPRPPPPFPQPATIDPSQTLRRDDGGQGLASMSPPLGGINIVDGPHPQLQPPAPAQGVAFVTGLLDDPFYDTSELPAPPRRVTGSGSGAGLVESGRGSARQPDADAFTGMASSSVSTASWPLTTSHASAGAGPFSPLPAAPPAPAPGSAATAMDNAVLWATYMPERLLAHADSGAAAPSDAWWESLPPDQDMGGTGGDDARLATLNLAMHQLHAGLPYIYPVDASADLASTGLMIHMPQPRAPATHANMLSQSAPSAAGGTGFDADTGGYGVPVAMPPPPHHLHGIYHGPPAAAAAAAAAAGGASEHRRRPKPRAPSSGARYHSALPATLPRKRSQGGRSVSGSSGGMGSTTPSPTPEGPGPGRRGARAHRRSVSLQSLYETYTTTTSSAAAASGSDGGTSPSGSHCAAASPQITTTTTPSRGAVGKQRRGSLSGKRSFSRGVTSNNNNRSSSNGSSSSTQASPRARSGSYHPGRPSAATNTNTNTSTSRSTSTGASASTGRRASSGIDGGTGGVDFVNFTPSDHGVLMAGVAPSGSSKTKARREREAAERQRRLSEAFAKAVAAAGGDVRALVEGST